MRRIGLSEHVVGCGRGLGLPAGQPWLRDAGAPRDLGLSQAVDRAQGSDEIGGVDHAGMLCDVAFKCNALSHDPGVKNNMR